MHNSLRIAAQCTIDGPGVPSDHSPAKTMKMVTRASGLSTAIIGEPGRLAPQLFELCPKISRMDYSPSLVSMVSDSSWQTPQHRRQRYEHQGGPIGHNR